MADDELEANAEAQRAARAQDGWPITDDDLAAINALVIDPVTQAALDLERTAIALIEHDPDLVPLACKLLGLSTELRAW